MGYQLFHIRPAGSFYERKFIESLPDVFFFPLSDKCFAIPFQIQVIEVSVPDGGFCFSCRKEEHRICVVCHTGFLQRTLNTVRSGHTDKRSKVHKRLVEAGTVVRRQKVFS